GGLHHDHVGHSVTSAVTFTFPAITAWTATPGSATSRSHTPSTAIALAAPSAGLTDTSIMLGGSMTQATVMAGVASGRVRISAATGRRAGSTWSVRAAPCHNTNRQAHESPRYIFRSYRPGIIRSPPGHWRW